MFSNKLVLPFDITDIFFFFILFVPLFFTVMFGLITRRSYDKKHKTTLLQLFTGSAFITLTIEFVYFLFSKVPILVFFLVALFSGLGCKNIIETAIKEKTWKKFDLVNRIDILKKFFPFEFKDEGEDEDKKNK